MTSIDHRKRARLRAAANRLWRDRYKRLAGIERVRFDVASVTFGDDGSVVVEHVAAAF
jgi:putative endonuclease